MTHSAKYRPEIDGLRAIAVLPVVLYHFGVPGFSGGFVGVDIFFVISGFLIGGLLWAELENTGRIALGAFFMRRIRRLAPAYIATALATLIGAYFILLPFDFREFGQDLIAATVYLANVQFFRDSGYFDTAAELKPLLHTWSLAVEEQFYVVMPLLMLGLARWRAVMPKLLVFLGIGSFLACLWMMTLSQPAAFYLLPFRAWELLAGVCLAIWAQRSGFGWQLHGGLSWAGLALIAVAVFGFKAGDHFPGAYALVPVLGAALIIANGKHANPINAMLCSRPFLFFGLISYSLYLWHWPLVTLLKYYRGDSALSGLDVALLLVIAIAAAWLSLRFIETPVRRGTLPGWKLLGAYVASATALVGFAFTFAFSDGWPTRFNEQSRPYIAATRGFHQDWSRCTNPTQGPWAGERICPIGPEGDPQVLVWGDSHGRAFKEGVDKLAHEMNVPGLLIWRGGCPPLAGVLKVERVSSPAEEAQCAASPDVIKRGLAGTPGIDTVLLIGRWAYYAEGTGVGADAHNWITLSPAPEPGLPEPDLLQAAITHTVNELSPLVERIFVLRQAPEMFDYSARAAAQAIAYGRLSETEVRDGIGTTTFAEVATRSAGADLALTQGIKGTKAELIDLWGALCDDTNCRAYLDDLPIYFDNNHVTNAGAIGLRDHFRPVFEGG